MACPYASYKCLLHRGAYSECIYCNLCCGGGGGSAGWT